MRLQALVWAVLLLPLAMFVGHAVAYRVLRWRGKAPTAHASAIYGIALSVAVIVLAVVASGAGALPIAAIAGQLAFVAAAGAAFGILYLDVVNIAETSLHMHLLLRVLWSEPASLQGLLEAYNPSRMIRERLGRLTGLGQVVQRDDRYYVRDRSVLRFARAIDAWKRILGLPQRPDAS